MIRSRFDEITEQHIAELVSSRVAEHKTLEYKERFSVGNDEERAEFLSDVSSFANASGGDIIYGISDERDATGRATGIP